MSLNELGFELIQEFIDLETASLIIDDIDSVLLSGKGGGIRNAEKKFSSISALASADYILSYASKYLSDKPRLVRAILFDKSPENNWLVTWHQDKTIALSSKFDAVGWSPWTIKDGVHHVHPPLEVLNDMVTFRIHLDQSSLKNGCLKVIPKSHNLGILSQESIYSEVKLNDIKIVEAPALSALVMRPHLLHASSKATDLSRRRVLHLEYSSYPLPEGVNWT